MGSMPRLARFAFLNLKKQNVYHLVDEILATDILEQILDTFSHPFLLLPRPIFFEQSLSFKASSLPCLGGQSLLFVDRSLVQVGQALAGADHDSSEIGKLTCQCVTIELFKSVGGPVVVCVSQQWIAHEHEDSELLDILESRDDVTAVQGVVRQVQNREFWTSSQVQDGMATLDNEKKVLFNEALFESVNTHL